MRRSLLALAALLVLAPGAAAAPGPWAAPPVDVSASALGALDPRVAIARDGTATVIWRSDAGTDGVTGNVYASVRPPGGVFGAPVQLSRDGQVFKAAELAVAPDGTTTVTWERYVGVTPTVQAATRPPGGAFGEPVDVSPSGQYASGPQLAVAADGTTTVAWLGGGILTSTRPPGGAFGEPVDVSQTAQSVSDHHVFAGPDGTTFVTWNRGTALQVGVRPAGGTFAAPVEVAASSSPSHLVQMLFAADGTATVYVDEDIVTFDVRARTRPPGGAFGPLTPILETSLPASWTRMAQDVAGEITMTWDAGQGARQATRPAGQGFFGAPDDIPGSGGAVDQPELAVDPDGTTTVVWQRALATGVSIIQATTRTTGAFAPPVDLSATDLQAGNARVAVAPDGNLTVVWSAGVGGRDVIQARTSGFRPTPTPVVLTPPSSGKSTPEPDPPAAVRRALITGTPKVGRTLTCTRRAFTGATRTNVRWLRTAYPIPGAVRSRYKLTRRDRGKRISCEVRASGPGGSARMVSRAVLVRR